MSKVTPFVYQATLERVVDGDTIDVTLDLGFLSLIHISEPTRPL